MVFADDLHADAIGSPARGGIDKRMKDDRINELEQRLAATERLAALLIKVLMTQSAAPC